MGRLRILLCMLLGSLCVTAGATFHQPDDTVPVERLVENLTRFIDEHPDDAGAVFTLGRVYSFAYAFGKVKFEVYKRGPYWEPALYGASIPSRQLSSGPATSRHMDYLLQAIQHLRRAVELDSTNGLYWLGLGYSYLEAALHADDLTWTFTGSKFDEEAAANVKDKRFWQNLALDAYRKARNSDPDPYPVEGVAVSAAHETAAILEARAELTDSEKKELRRVRRIASNASSAPRMITPIIFSPENLPLKRMAVSRKVSFDLDGLGRNMRWSWVRPGTAFLAWDPHGTGRITSGKQLFGNVTWWMFWRNGYEALAALDDDGNGWLEGGELAGVAVWRDMDGDGVSDAGEVTPAAAFGVQGIQTRAAGVISRTPWAREGIRMSDGTTLATYDWASTPGGRTK